jgi:microcystin-dependent protein
MTAVDIFKATRMKEIEDTTVVGGLIDPNGHLLLSTRAGDSIDAGMTKGDPGIPGDPGPTGPAGTITGATAAGLASGADPTVDLGGTPEARTFAFGIPKGDKGDPGSPGPAGDAALPAGTISLWASDVAPNNWLICDGSAVSRTTYASLFAVIGTKYGAGDGVNTFNLPNLKGQTPIGKDTAQTEFAALNQKGGEKKHLLTVAELPSHRHALGFRFGPANVYMDQGGTFATADVENRWLANNTAGWGYIDREEIVQSIGGNGSHNILQPYTVVNFIIKISNGDTPSDSQLTQRVTELEAVNNTLPAGTISLWSSDVIPQNWMICDGSAISRTQYASLFEAIGIKYGAGDGVNTFNLPNFKGRAPVGKDSAQTEFAALAQTGGEKTHLLTTNEMPAHTHTSKINTAYVYGAPGAGSTIYGVNNAGVDPTSSTGGGAAHNNLQPYQVVHFIIKVTAGETAGDSELATRVAALEANASPTPAGTVTIWGGAAAPTNWLLCDGSAVSRTTYASLFAAIGTAYGVGDGSTTFNLPNLKGRIPVGRDAAQTEFDVLGETGGEKTHLLTVAEMPAHKHTDSGHSHAVNSSTGVYGGGVAVSYAFGGALTHAGYGGGLINNGAANIQNTGGDGAHNNLQPYQVLNYIIKFTNGDTKADSQLTQRVSVLESGTGLLARQEHKLALMQAAMSGGGNRKVTSTSIAWTIAFRLMGSGVDELTPSGYFNISMPPDGTVIPVIGSPTVTSTTVSGGKIDFSWASGYSVLYYKVPWYAVRDTQNDRFLIVEWNGTPTAGVVPEGCVFVAARNGDDDSPRWKWGDGRHSDDWKNMGLNNGWVAYGGGTEFGPAQWRWTDAGEVELRGLIAGGAAAAIAQFGTDQYPEYTNIYTVESASGTARIDMSKVGTLVLVGYSTGGSNAYVSLVGIRWHPAGG